MPGVGGAVTPGRSAIEAWDTEHLQSAAKSWTDTATLWEQSFETVHRGALRPGGTEWTGEGADAAGERTFRDLVTVCGAADHLHSAAGVARRGADRLDYLKRMAVLAIDDAEAAGFTVGENLSLTDTRVFPVGPALQARQAQAEALAGEIHTRAAALGLADREVAASIGAALSPLSEVRFAEAPQSGGGFAPLDNKQSPADKPATDDPNHFRDEWNSLSDSEKQQRYDQDHSIGNHGGMPFTERDVYNRQHLDELQQQSDAEIARLRAEHPDWADGRNLPPWRHPSDEALEWKAKWDAANHLRDGYNAVENSLNSSDGVPRYLSFIDDKGHAAVSIGNPDTAKRTATFVPGTGQDMATFDGSFQKSLKMYRAALDADPALAKSDVAVTTWMGYDRPMDLVQAASPDRAVNGGAALDAYLNGMHASHVGPAAIDTVIGHSYGSTLVGGAATGGNHLAADNVIAVGSPGMLAQHASDLSLDSGAHVFASRAENDVIGVVTYATLGPDPMARQFGGIPFEAAPGPVAAPLGLPAPLASALGIPSVAAHSSYWDPGNPALANMGRIIAGQLSVTPPTFTP